MVMSKIFSQGVASRLTQGARRYASGHAADSHGDVDKMWKKIFFFVAVPAVIVCSIHTYIAEVEHWEHWRRPKYIPYEYRNVRTRKFPWGDGQHSLFHNTIVNPLPTGYEPLSPELSAKYDPLPEGEEGHH